MTTKLTLVPDKSKMTDYEIILEDSKNQVVALLYFKDNNLLTDIYIIFLTIINVFNRKFALKMIYKFMIKKYKMIDFEFILREKQLSKIDDIKFFFEAYEDKLF